MQAFKVFLKIVPRKFLLIFVIYTAVFVGLITFFTYSESKGNADVFELSKINVAVINRDEGELSKNVEKYIGDTFRKKEIGTDEESIKDALFYRDVDFIVIIPSGFSKNFMTSEKLQLETMSIPNSPSTAYAKTIINSYLNTTRLHMSANPNLTAGQVHEKVLSDVSVETNVSFLERVKDNAFSQVYIYFNFLGYIIMAMLITMVGRIMLIFNNKELKRRNFGAPISPKSYNMQLLLGNMSIAFIVFIIMVAVGLILHRDSINSNEIYLYIINSFVLTILCLSISFFVSSFATKNSIDPIGNCLSLGLSFLGGAFLPQELISDKIKNIAIFNPMYWYVRSNDKIYQISSISFDQLKPILLGILIQLAFAATFLAVALVIIKQKRTAD